MSLGPAEILVVLVLALVVFGPKRLPEVGRQVGGALRELRKVQDTVQSEIRSVLDDTVGPVRAMHPNELLKSTEPRAITSEPDLGAEHAPPPVPEATPAETPATTSATDIEDLSGGTFS